MLADSLPDSNAFELLLWLFRLRRRVRVDGASMIPTLAPGDEVLVDPRAFQKRRPQVGDIVVARRPDREEIVMVKRVARIATDGGIILVGDNPGASTDSQTFGAVSPELLTGKVTSRFA